LLSFREGFDQDNVNFVRTLVVLLERASLRSRLPQVLTVLIALATSVTSLWLPTNAQNRDLVSQDILATGSQSWQSLDSEARIRLEAGNARAAATLWTRVLALQERSLESDAPELLETLSRLSEVSLGLGEYGKSLEYGVRAMRGRTDRFGVQSIEVSENYLLLSNLERALGDSRRALEFAKKTVRIRTLDQQSNLQSNLQSNQQSSPQADFDLGMAVALEALARSQAANNDAKAALETMRLAFTARLKQYAANAPELVPTYLSLGDVLLRGAQPVRALEQYQKAKRVLEAHDQTLGQEMANAMNGIGQALTGLKRAHQALQPLEVAVALREALLGPDHLETASVQHNLGAANLLVGNVRAAIEAFTHSAQSFLNIADQTFPMLDGPGKLKFNAANRYRMRALLRAICSDPEPTETNTTRALEAWLSFKGSAFSLENGLSPLYERASSIKDGIDEYFALKAELSERFTSTPATTAEAKANRERIDQLERRIAELERLLSGGTNGLSKLLELRRVSLRDLQTHLLEGEVYVDYAWFEDQVYALTMDANAHVRIARLPTGGTAKDGLPDLIARLRKALETSKSMAQLMHLTGALEQRLITPLAPALSEAKVMIISPDGPLHFLPFDLLGKRPLVERLTVRYTPTARDLLRLRLTPTEPALEASAVFGNPDFTAKSLGPAVAGATRSADEVYLTGLLRRSAFKPLPETATEAKAVAERLGPSTQIFMGGDANEQNLFSLKSPRVLHMATHGFFLSDPGLPNPLLRVGLALAGARSSAVAGSGYGLLSALRLEGLSLRGTELVTLSACDTGLGDAFAGEGVAGLNQAFLAAGARRVMLSLWKVPDRETSLLMQDFYTRYANGDDPAEALRAAKLELHKQGLPPRDWAAFVLNGE
jgi:CHAT domain-containing protein